MLFSFFGFHVCAYLVRMFSLLGRVPLYLLFVTLLHKLSQIVLLLCLYFYHTGRNMIYVQFVSSEILQSINSNFKQHQIMSFIVCSVPFIVCVVLCAVFECGV
jgi:hypothetical protein